MPDDPQALLLQEIVDEVLEGRLTWTSYRDGLAAADGALGFLLVLKGVSVDAGVAGVEHVIVEVRIGGGGDLESLVAARS